MKTSVLLAVISGGLVVSALAQTNIDIDRYGVGKNVFYEQTSATAPTTPQGYFYEAFVDPKNGGTLNSGTINNQGSGNTYTMSASGDLNYSSTTYANAAALNAVYAAGTQTFSINGAGGLYSASLLLSGDAYPSVVPAISNTTWAGGKLELNAYSASTIAFNSFVGNTTLAQNNFAIVMTIEGTFQNSVVGLEYFSRTTTGSFTVGANEFISGNTYNVTLGFLQIVDGYEIGQSGAPIHDGNGNANALGLAFYSTQTSFQIQAVPEPSTYVLMGLGAGLLALPWLRRRLTR